jgi:soluble lytic murein transglycosylase
LVREESHFDAAVSSHAGAVGLSQLMPATAVDVASRMGLPRPSITDLRDPQLNLSIGAWYLDHLMGRTDTTAEALYAYNGGLTRVRRWKDQHSSLPEDIFQEMIPFPETLHYGRKILVSYTIYRYLYGSAVGAGSESGLDDRIALFWPEEPDIREGGEGN